MELNFKTFGGGPGLIILHGLFGSLDNWQTLAKQYAEHFSVFIVDQRNHGKSPHTDEEFTYQAMAEDLAEFMDQHGMVRAHLMGHSMGGKTVMKFASHWPERIERMVVADMSPRRNKPTHLEILDALNRFPLKEIQRREEADEWLRTAVPDVPTRMFILKSLERSKEGGFEWKFNVKTITRDYENILEEIRMDFPVEAPALFIRGGLSGYVADTDWPLIEGMFPHARLETVQGAGHWLHADKPKEYFEQTMRFLMG